MRTPFLVAALLSSLFAAPTRAQTTLFFDDFEQGTSQWTLTNNWRLASPGDPCYSIAGTLPSGTHFLRWGRAIACDFDDGVFEGTATMVTPVVLPSGAGSLELSFATNSAAEDWLKGDWDARWIRISTDGGLMWTTLPLIHSSPWYRHVYDLSNFAGQSVLVRFDFDAVDGLGNSSRGWFIDDVAIVSRSGPGVPFCFGDWCPCTNNGASGNGCASSIHAAGGLLTSSGTASVAADSVVLGASGMSTSVVTFFQGTGTVFDGLYGSGAFGDGRRCVNGTLIRLHPQMAPGGAVQIPAPGDASLSVQGAIPAAGGSRYYQVWYRNSASFCTPATFNLTNGLMVTWHP